MTAMHGSQILWKLLLPPGVWALHFFAVYGAHAFACARLAPPHTLLHWLLYVATLAALGVLAVFAVKPAWLGLMQGKPGQGDATHLVVSAARLLAVLSFLGVAWAFLAVIILPECQGGAHPVTNSGTHWSAGD